MRFAAFILSRAGLCLAIWLYAALGASAQCRFERDQRLESGQGGSERDRVPRVWGSGYVDLINRLTSQRSTYHIRVPDFADPTYQIPVVVILHDAGRNAAAIINDERLIEAFVGKGYAVLAPDALPRRNARISYCGNKPGLIESQMSGLPIVYWKKRYLVTGIDGTIRYMKFGTDSGWYFYNVDKVFYSSGAQTELLGRDEIHNLRNVLGHAELEYGIDPDPVLVIGLGHGGSLVWQIACYAPKFGQILAPVGGAFWRNIPKNCTPGAHLVHTHHRASAFWPLAGAKRKKRRYARTSIYRNLEMLLSGNNCGPDTTTDRNDKFGVNHTTWADCTEGGPVEFMVLDEAFAFPSWWLDEMLGRIELTGIERPPEAPEVPLEIDPAFMTPGTGTGFKTSGTETGFEAPGAGTGFKTPGAGTGSRFKRAK